MKDRLSPLPIPSRKGRIAIVTGANSGIGLATARALGLAGAKVTLAVRNAERGQAALASLRRDVPQGDFSLGMVDTSSLASVKQFADAFGGGRLDILICNAGTSAPRQRAVTEEGHELAWATNYLGHFALAGRLLENLRQGSRPRVVTVGSLMANRGHLDFADLELEQRYDATRAYSNSKLAQVMFARELQRRSAAEDWGINAHAAHPGWSDTAIFGRGRLMRLGIGLGGLGRFVQSANDGAQPVVFAAASRQAVAGAYYGPVTRGGLSGPAGRARLPALAKNAAALDRLWDRSIEATGVTFSSADSG